MFKQIFTLTFGTNRGVSLHQNAVEQLLSAWNFLHGSWDPCRLYYSVLLQTIPQMSPIYFSQEIYILITKIRHWEQVYL